MRVFASGVTELWADGVRPGHRMDALGAEALEAERPLHVAPADGQQTLCGMPLRNLREYPVDFTALDQRVRCPRCDESLGHPTR